MINKLKALAVAAIVAVTPFAASAATVSPTATIADTGIYDIADGPFFWGIDLVDNDVADSVSFTFENNGAIDQAIGLAEGTLLQISGALDFLTVSWAGGETHTMNAIQSAVTTVMTFDVKSVIGASSSDVLTISWGAVDGQFANIDIIVSAVPLPAGGLLLIGALGALGVARRRKS